MLRNLCTALSCNGAHYSHQQNAAKGCTAMWSCLQDPEAMHTKAHFSQLVYQTDLLTLVGMMFVAFVNFLFFLCCELPAQGLMMLKNVSQKERT